MQNRSTGNSLVGEVCVCVYVQEGIKWVWRIGLRHIPIMDRLLVCWFFATCQTSIFLKWVRVHDVMSCVKKRWLNSSACIMSR